MNKGVKLLIVLALVAVLAAAAVIVPGLFNKDETDDSVSDTSSENMTLFEEKDVDTFSYEYRNEQIVVKRLETGKWTVAEDEDFPLIQSYPSDMIDALRVLKVKRTLDGEKLSLSDYGLDDPLYYYKVTLKDGKTIDYRLGNYNSMLDGIYLKFADKNDVYIVEDGITDVFLSGTLDMIMRESLPEISRANVTKAELTSAGASQTIDVEKESFEGEGEETDANGEKEKVTYTRFTYTVTDADGKTMPGYAANVEKLLDALLAVKTGSCVAFKPTSEELVSFGLDPEHSLGIKLYYTEKVQDNNSDNVVDVTVDKDSAFTLGSANGEFYVTVGGDRVYKVDKENGAAVFEALVLGLIAPEAEDTQTAAEE